MSSVQMIHERYPGHRGAKSACTAKEDVRGVIVKKFDIMNTALIMTPTFRTTHIGLLRP